MGQAEVISLDAVRASKQWASLRQQLHDYFDLWLDDLQAKRRASIPGRAAGYPNGSPTDPDERN
jgi:hypothetical protein